MSSSPTETTLVDVAMPQMGVSVAEGTIVAWHKQVGDWVRGRRDDLRGHDRQDRHGDPVARDRPAGRDPRGAGRDRRRRHRRSRGSRTDATARARRTWPSREPRARGRPRSPRRYSPGRPAHRRRARHRPRRGPGHRPRRPRAQAGRPRARRRGARDADEPPLHTESPYRPDAGAGGAGGQLSRMRRTIGEHMKRSLDTAATCTTWIEADMGRVERARAQLGLTALPIVGARRRRDAARASRAERVAGGRPPHRCTATCTSASPSRSATTGSSSR